MARWLIVTASVFFSILSQAQPGVSAFHTISEQLQAQQAQCKALLDSSQYKLLIQAARKGISLSPESNPLYRGRFFYYAGYGYEHTNNSYDSATYEYETAERYARKSGDMRDETNALMRLNYMYYSIGRFARRDSLLQIIKRITDTTRNNFAQAVLNGSIGEYYLDVSQYENFIFYKLKAIDYRKKLTAEEGGASNRDNIGISYLQVANGYLKMKQPQKAIEYLDYGQEYISGSRNGKAYLCNEYMEAYSLTRQPDSIRKCYNSVYAMVSKDDSLYINLSYANRVMADYCLQQQQTDSAFYYGKKAVTTAQKADDEESEVEANATFGAVLYKKGNYTEAIRLLEAILPKAYGYDKEIYRNTEKNLSLSYAAASQWQQAFQHSQSYSRISDSLNAEAVKKNIAEYEAKYQNKEKGREIQAKNRELALARVRTLWMITGLILLVAIAGLMGIIYRNKRKTATALDRKNKKLAVLNQNLAEANATKARLFSIISHDLRSPISQVYQFLKLQQLNPKLLNEEQKQQLNHKIQEATGSLLETMEDLLLWSKTQMEGFETRMTTLVLRPAVEQCLSLLQLNSEAKALIIQNDIPGNASIYADAYFLQTILRNLLQNAMKAAPENSILQICLHHQPHGSVLTIHNDGKPFTQSQYEALLADAETGKSLSGLGLRLVDELSRKMGTAVSFSIESGNGASASLVFAPGGDSQTVLQE